MAKGGLDAFKFNQTEEKIETSKKVLDANLMKEEISHP